MSTLSFHKNGVANTRQFDINPRPRNTAFFRQNKPHSKRFKMIQKPIALSIIDQYLRKGTLVFTPCDKFRDRLINVKRNSSKDELQQFISKIVKTLLEGVLVVPRSGPL